MGDECNVREDYNPPLHLCDLHHRQGFLIMLYFILTTSVFYDTIDMSCDINYEPSVRRFVNLMRMLVLILFILNGLVFSLDWNSLVIDYIYGPTEIEIDTLDHPHIVYTWAGRQLRYAHWDGSEWHSEIITDIDCNPMSMALDSNDCPHIVFYSHYNTSLLYYHWDGFTWQYECIESMVKVDSLSLDMDSQNRPHIAYKTHYDFDLIYEYFDGSTWIINTIENESLYGGNPIYINSEDNPCVAFIKDSDLKYAEWNGSEWDIQIVDTPGEFYFTGISLTLGLDDSPHLIYYENTNMSEGNLKYAYFIEGTWEINTVVSNEISIESSLAVDSENHPHITYHRYPYALDLIYAYWNGDIWYFETIDDYEAGIYNSIALDSNNNPQISYIRGIYPETTYTWIGDPMPEIILTSFTAEPTNSNSILLKWSVEATEGESISGFNLYRRELGLMDKNQTPGSEDSHPRPDTNHDDTWSLINPHPITGENPYSYIDDTVKTGTTYEYRLEAVVDNTPEVLGTTTGTCGIPTSFDIKIYPNPITENRMTIDISSGISEDDIVEMEIYDITGRLIRKEKFQVNTDNNLIDIDTSSLSSGVYILKARITGGNTSMTSSEEITKKFVVVR